MTLLLLAFLLTMSTAFAGDPQFDPQTLMRLVLVPADAAVGSVIYRLKASDQDFDYPLQFELLDEASKSFIRIDTLNCTRYNSMCQANVVLQRRLEAGRFYDFRVRVKDTKGGSSTISCSISATNATTPRDTIFPRIPELIMVREDARRGTELDYVVARKNPLVPKPVYLELWGSPLFAIRQRVNSPETTEGTIFLLGPLDFEKQAMYHLTILANDPYAEPREDSRNIAGIQIVVVVEDVQDMPPVFTEAPPVTRLDSNLVPGDVIARVHAEDGDRGSPRPIRYGLVSEGNPFTPFFNVSDEDGTITLVRPLEEIAAISHPGVPILLTIVAEEIKTNRDEPPAMSSTVQLALILGEPNNQPPYFENDNYVSRIDENAPQGTALVFADPYIPLVSDDDTGKNGVFALTLENNNGTFEVSPNVGERRVTFIVRVRDNAMLDFEERESVIFKIVAQELGPVSNLTASADVIVFLNDVNDNPPEFLESVYEVELPENMTAGTRVVQVKAEDVDTGLFGKVRYTQILGHQNTSLNLDPVTGIITVNTDNHGFDREVMPEFKFYVEAADEDGVGNRATVPLIIKLIDVNDEPPRFEKSLYEFILSPDLSNFTSPAIIHAVDFDSEPPNNIVRYELIHGNYENKFVLNEVTGELTLREPLNKNTRKKRNVNKKDGINGEIERSIRLRRNVSEISDSELLDRLKRQNFDDFSKMGVYSLTARAYDLGIPHLSTVCEIRIYPPESNARTLVFIVPGRNPDIKKTEEMLGAISGGRASIQEIRPYNGREIGVKDLTPDTSDSDKSVVVATILYNSKPIVDISKIHQNITASNYTIVSGIPNKSEKEDISAKEYRAENRLLFWLLMLLALLILLTILIMVLCCICAGCPLYVPPKKRVIRASSHADDVHLVVKEKGIGQENKSVQAVEWGGRATRKEAWSADIADTRTKATQWQFNRRNNRNKDAITATHSYGNGSLKDVRASDERSTLRMRDGPNVIYSKEWQKKNAHNKDIYLEDMDGEYTSISRADEHHRQRHIDEDIETDSLKRHEVERGSELEYRNSLRRNARRQMHSDDDQQPTRDGEVDARDQLFIRDGNTEILRLITRGRNDDIIHTLNQQGRPVTLITGQQQPQYVMVDGKDILMQRFIEQQHVMHPGVMHQEYTQRLGHDNLMARSAIGSVIIPDEQQREYMHNIPGAVNQEDSGSFHAPANTPQQGISKPSTAYRHQDLLETSLRQQNELLRQILLEKERLQQREMELLRQEEVKLETQSLPGQSVMATQTDVNIATQTDPIYLRPAKRRTRSDNDDTGSEDGDDDYHIYIIDGSGDGNSGIRWLRRRKHYKRRRTRLKDDDGSRRTHRVVEEVKRKIRTPIMEESESPVQSAKRTTKKNHEVVKKNYGETRTSLLRKKKTDDHVDKGESERKTQEKPERPTKSQIRKDILLEISESLDDQRVPSLSAKRPKLGKQPPIILDYYESGDESENKRTYSKKVGKLSDVFSDDSLECGEVNENIIEAIRTKSSRSSSSKNVIFSRQGSSTEAREVSESDRQQTGSSNKLSSGKENNNREKNITTLTTETESTSTQSKQNEEVPKKPEKSPKPKELEKVSPRTSDSRPTSDAKKQSLEDKKIDVSKSLPRYMQWYKKGSDKQDTKSSKESEKPAQRTTGRTSVAKKSTLTEKKTSTRASNETLNKKDEKNVKKESIKQDTTKSTKDEKIPAVLKDELQQSVSTTELNNGQSRPLLQHSEHRYEHMYPYPPMMYAQPAHLPQTLYPQPVQYIQAHPVLIQHQMQPAEILSNAMQDQNRPVEATIPKQATTASEQTGIDVRIDKPPKPPTPAKRQTVPQKETAPKVPQRSSVPFIQQTQPSLNNTDTSQSVQKSSNDSQSLDILPSDDRQQKSIRIEDNDYDSGIAMASLQMKKKPQITEKKSVFTIAYDDMHTKQIRADSSDSPPF